MSEIYVTGSSGVLGFEALEHLHRIGHFSVSGVSRRSLPVERPELRNIHVTSVFDADWLPDGGSDATVVHFAGLSDPRAEFDGFADLSVREIVPHVEMVERMLARGWRGHLIYISSGGAIYGDAEKLPIAETEPPRPKGYYALQKISVENALLFLANQHEFRLTILRVSNPYGSHVLKKGQGVIPILIDAAINDRSFTVFGSGEELRDYIHVSDVTLAIERLCDAPPAARINTINIGSGVGTSLNQLLDLVGRLTGHRIRSRYSATPYDVKSNVLDITRARRLLDWEPRIGIREGIQAMVDDWQALQPHAIARR